MNRKLRRSIKNVKTAKTVTPSQIATMFAFAVDAHKSGRFLEAKNKYLEILAIDNRHCTSYNNLGLILQMEGHIDDAEKMFTNAVILNNGYVDAFNNLGNLHNSLGNVEKAVYYYSMALQANPNSSSVYVNLGNALQSKGRFDEAGAHYQKALSIDCHLTEAHVSMGNLLSRLKRYDDAVRFYQNALSLDPDYPNAYNNLGYAYRIQSRVVRAAKTFERGLRIDIDHFDTYVNYGGTHKDLGRVDVAIRCYERALSLNPNSINAMSNLLFAHNYTDGLTVEAISKRHFDVGRRISEIHPDKRLPYQNLRDQGRKLKIGYVSPDLRQHAVAFFFEPLMRHHDRSRFEIYCYAEVFVEDHVSKALQGLSNQWLNTVGMNDDELEARIRADGIDILVDLAGHTAHSRIGIFARRPAPVQVTWLGYPNTTGIKNIDYRLVDAITDPPGRADTLAAETLLRLPGVFLCYQPPPDAPDPVALPCETSGTITFGTFSTLAKLSPSTLDAWAAILKRVPNSRLLLKSRLFIEEESRELYRSRLVERGVAAERLTFMDPIPDTAGHLGSYNLIDITLDPFPYNGTTTTCEALWMGVPMIVLAGTCHAGRVGMSLLNSVGLNDLVAETPDQYVEIAGRLATDLPRLKALRTGLRDRMKVSRLCDAPQFTQSMERTYREIWQAWCEGKRNPG